MTKLDVVKTVLDGGKLPYVPWHIILSKKALERYTIHYKINDIENHSGNHLIRTGSTLGFFTDMDHDCKMNDFGVVWDMLPIFSLMDYENNRGIENVYKVLFISHNMYNILCLFCHDRNMDN